MSQALATSEKERAKQILGEIIRHTGGRLTSKADLVRVFWRAHLLFAESQAGYLSFWPILKTASGPAIKDVDVLLGEMVAECVLRIDELSGGPTSALQLELTDVQPPESLAAEAIEAIQSASAASAVPAVANYRALRSWNEASIGEELNIYLDAIPAAEYDQRNAHLQSMSAALKDVWR